MLEAEMPYAAASSNRHDGHGHTQHVSRAMQLAQSLQIFVYNISHPALAKAAMAYRGKDTKNAVPPEFIQLMLASPRRTYDAAAAAKLPYARLMVMADQDVDGSHIAGLVYNFIDSVAPSLLAAKPDFLSRFATSLIRVAPLVITTN